MDHIFSYLKLGIAGFGTGLTYLFGGWDAALIALVIFIAIDYFTGVLCAIINKKLSSEIGAKGLAKKAMILLILILAATLDKILGNPDWVCRTLVCYFYIANEGISILENAAKLGIPVPDKIVSILEQLKNKADTD